MTLFIGHTGNNQGICNYVGPLIQKLGPLVPALAPWSYNNLCTYDHGAKPILCTMDESLLSGLDRKEFNNWLMARRVLLHYGCKQEVAEHERRVRVPRGDNRGVSVSSFLSA